MSEDGSEGRAPASGMKRGPYRTPATRFSAGHERPSGVLAENIRCYRRLQGMTQHQLAARMTVLGHEWGRSVVSAIEGGRRGVTIDEVFGLAINLGVTVGRLLDPSGPDHSRKVGLDVGLGSVGSSHPLPTELGRLFAASRAVIRLVDDDTGTIELEMAPDAMTTRPQEPGDLGAGFGFPVRERLKTPLRS